MLNYKEYAKRADLERGKALIGYVIHESYADEDWKKKVLEDVEKNIGGITRVKKEESR